MTPCAGHIRTIVGANFRLVNFGDTIDYPYYQYEQQLISSAYLPTAYRIAYVNGFVLTEIVRPVPYSIQLKCWKFPVQRWSDTQVLSLNEVYVSIH